MLLDKLFELPLDAWQERIACAAFLAGTRPSPDSFESETALRISAAAEKLGELPRSWARELAIAVLKQERS